MVRTILLASFLAVLPSACSGEDQPHAVVAVQIVAPDGPPVVAQVLAHASFVLGEGVDEVIQRVDRAASLSLSPGEWALSASAPGLASEPEILHLDHGEVASVTLRLVPAGMVQGRVTRPDGTPAFGVSVRGLIVTTWSQGSFTAEAEAVCAAATTDAEGRYELHVRPGPIYPYAESGGLLSPCGRVEPAKGETATCDLALVEGKTISGRVLDREGRGLVGAELWVLPYDHPPGGRVPNFRRSVKTGEDGVFVVGHLPEGSYGVDASAEGHVREYREKVASGTSELEITLKDCGRIEGKISLPEGSLGEGVAVGVVPLGGTHSGASGSQVNQDGTFFVEGLAPGRYAVVARAKGFAPAIGDPVDVPEGGTVDGVVLELSPGGALHGHVVASKDGAPVFQAHLSIGTESRKSGKWAPIDHLLEGVTTDANGAFAWEDLAPGEYELSVRHPDFGPRERTVRIEREKKTEIEVKLPSAARVFGRVLDAGGKPKKGAIVDTMAHGRAVADDEGRYEIDGLPPGEITLCCREGGEGLGGFGDSQVQKVHLDPGQSIEVNFPPSGGVRVFGVVRCGERVLPDVEVMMIPSDGTSRESTTNAKGEYEFVGLPPGDCYATASGVQVSFAIPDGGTEFRKDFDLPTGALSGSVRIAATRKPPDIVGVTVFGEGDESEPFFMRMAGSARSKPDGTFEVIGLKAGKYTVIVRSSPLATEILRNVEVPETGAAKPIEIELVPGGRMHLLVVDEEGKGIDQVFLALWELPSKTPNETMDSTCSTSGQGGAYEILESFRPGDYVLGVFDHIHLPVGVPVHITAGEQAEVKATLGRGGMAILTVKDEEGKPVEDGAVVVLDAEGKPVDTTLGMPMGDRLPRGPGGKIGVALPLGKYRGEVTSGDRTGTFEATIQEGPPAEIDVVLRAK